MAKLIRLDKLLSEMGCGTRRELKLLCKRGFVQVNDEYVRDSAVKIDSHIDKILFQGDPVVYQERYYFMLNKPAGVVSATVDEHSNTVIQLFTDQYPRRDLFPVGRLDKDTEGLLLVTNDGVWAHHITTPKKHVVKTYLAHVSGEIPPSIQTHFSAGVVLSDGYHCAPAEVAVLAPDLLRIFIHEGKYHQVKRMCAAVGITVTALKRTAIGGLNLDKNLLPGAFRELTEQERAIIFL